MSEQDIEMPMENPKVENPKSQVENPKSQVENPKSQADKPEEGNGRSTARKIGSTLKEYIESILIALVLTFLVQSFVIGNHLVPSSSMEDTLRVGDRLFTVKFTYGLNVRLFPLKLPFFTIGRWRPDGRVIDIYYRLRDPRRGDVIVFRSPQNQDIDLVKRIMGESGDRITIRGDKVYVNGQLQDEPYTRYISGVYRGGYPYDDVVVPEGHFFVMGDNRDNSLDSRYWGFVPRRNILGRVFLIYFPFSHFRFLK
jgi:signal peptidase I